VTGFRVVDTFVVEARGFVAVFVAIECVVERGLVAVEPVVELLATVPPVLRVVVTVRVLAAVVERGFVAVRDLVAVERGFVAVRDLVAVVERDFVAVL
jgi:acetolactate synthase regulatory subunit